MTSRSLFELNSTAEDWNYILSLYPLAIEELAIKKKRPILTILDTFWRTELPELATSRVPKHITLTELSKVMQWKLLHGKMRPLQKLVDSNEPRKVQSASQKAFEFMEHQQWEKAMDALTELKGVGPATASAILAPLYPDCCPFMADEAIEAVLPGGREYTIKAYTVLRRGLIQKASQLDGSFTAEAVGRALWIFTVLNESGNEVLRILPSQRSTVIAAVPSTASTTTKADSEFRSNFAEAPTQGVDTLSVECTNTKEKDEGHVVEGPINKKKKLNSKK